MPKTNPKNSICMSKQSQQQHTKGRRRQPGRGNGAPSAPSRGRSMTVSGVGCQGDFPAGCLLGRERGRGACCLLKLRKCSTETVPRLVLLSLSPSKQTTRAKGRAFTVRLTSSSRQLMNGETHGALALVLCVCVMNRTQGHRVRLFMTLYTHWWGMGF